MKLSFLIAACLVCFSAVVAQKQRGYPVKVGEIPNKVLPNEAMYLSPVFSNGTARFRDGTSSTRKFNYNFLLDEMHFIENGVDTLAIAEPVTLKSVTVDTMVFYYQGGYLREIFSTGKYTLAKRQEMVQVADRTRGGYDAAVAAGSIKTYGSINNNSQVYQLQVKKDVLFQQVNSYYIGNAFNHFVKANRKNIQLLFDQKKISGYLKKNKVNFNRENDLVGLLQFCVQ